MRRCVRWGVVLKEYPGNLPFSGPPVESQMPLYRWSYCAPDSKSLSSISPIRGEMTRVGQKWGGGGGGLLLWGLPGQQLITFMAMGPCRLLSLLPPVLMVNPSAIYLVSGANDSHLLLLLL